jgi:hypothetical protein
MNDSDLKKDQYTIGPAASGDNQNNIVCSDAKGNVLFNVSGTQFLDTKGKAIGEVKEGQNQSHEIYDGAGKLLGNIAQQKGQITLNDASNKPLAMATKDNNSGAFNITTPDGKSNIATVTVEGNGQQQGGGRGGFGGISQILGGGGMGQGFGMGNQNTQNTGQARLNISVQSQTIKPLLLLTFAYSLPHMLGQGGNKRRIGMGGMGSAMMMGGVASMLLGGLLGGRSGGGGVGGPRIPRMPRIR